MATFYVTNNRELKNLIAAKIVKPLLEYVSKKTVKIMQENLNNSEISTSTLEKSVNFHINQEGTESIIEIDYEFAQSFATDPKYERGQLVEWGRFTNSIGKNVGSHQWNGELLSFRVAEWLEYGGYGKYGNQPIPASNWFTKTKNMVTDNLDSWVREFLHSYKLI